MTAKSENLKPEKEIKTKSAEHNSANEQNKEQTQQTEATPIVSKQKLLEAGTYFGHKASQWHPKMQSYILKKPKNGTHILDVVKTQKTLEIAYQLIHKLASKGASFIFVGTKKQAKKVVEAQAERTNSIFVSERWLGGTLTNKKTILSRLKQMQELEVHAENNFSNYTKKEGVLMAKKLAKLQKNLNGIRGLKFINNDKLIMLVADPNKDIIAIKEAKKAKVKVIGIMDSNTDPSLLDFGIPANDDSVKSITLIFTILADAIATAKGGKALFAYQPTESIVLPEDPDKEQKAINKFKKFSADAQNQIHQKNFTARVKPEAHSKEKEENKEQKQGE
ncbi:30S ribosomal protein S2 [Mycoplasma sp. 1654_15]|uniref:30S ribosomal protein S2 n=1 Tax=Mycoplasma sp. 1654_15 TaxID=2725994 RepID=UPI00144917EB|nr:30S ribosomal protein S2 [Mycoplasma sp. 1654_15]QJB71190.1 30S ribosomal protein S2 [Mycoplasma sp. 1654_15]